MNIFVFKIKQEEAPVIYQQLDEEQCQWCSCHYYIKVKTLGSLYLTGGAVVSLYSSCKKTIRSMGK